MRRKALRTACLAGAFVLAAFPALSMTGVESLAQQLSEQGFTEVVMSKTILGRVRIRAKGPGIEREIIYNPVTGEILRDFWTTNASGAELTLLNPYGSGSGSGSSNSGSGSSNSGSGSGNYDDLEDALDDLEDARDDRQDDREDRRDDREDREDRDRDRD